jgi:hypothetical protein
VSVKHYTETINHTERIYNATVEKWRPSLEGNTHFPQDVGDVRAVVHELNGEVEWSKVVSIYATCKGQFDDFKEAVIAALDWAEVELGMKMGSDTPTAPPGVPNQPGLTSDPSIAED